MKIFDRRIKAKIRLALSKKDIKQVQKADFIKIIDNITDRNAPILANLVLQYTYKFFNWCIERGYLRQNPAANISKPAKQRPRNHFLRLGEDHFFYQAAVRYLGSIRCALPDS